MVEMVLEKNDQEVGQLITSRESLWWKLKSLTCSLTSSLAVQQASPSRSSLLHKSASSCSSRYRTMPSTRLAKRTLHTCGNRTNARVCARVDANRLSQPRSLALPLACARAAIDCEARWNDVSQSVSRIFRNFIFHFDYSFDEIMVGLQWLHCYSDA